MNSAAKYNAPRWYPSWTDQKTGKLCKGFWYVWDGQKKHNLSKLGAIRENVKPGSKAYMAGVAPAYQAWCDEQEQAEQVAEAEKVAKSGPVLVVDVANAYLNSIKGKKSYANIEIYLGKFLAFEKYGRLSPHSSTTPALCQFRTSSDSWRWSRRLRTRPRDGGD